MLLRGAAVSVIYRCCSDVHNRSLQPAQENVTVVYSTANGTAVSASDYTSASGTALSQLDQRQSPSWLLLQMTAPLSRKNTFSLSLGSVTTSLASLTVGTGVAVATIIDNDSATASIIPIVDAVETTIGAFGNSGGFLVSLSNPADSPVTVTYGICGSASNN